MSAVTELGARAKAASRVIATAGTASKNGALLTAADLLAERGAEIQAANDADLEAAAAGGMAAGPLDRLRLTDARLQAMANGLRTVAALPDPIGEVLDGWTRPNGLQITRVRVPLGVVAIIYENRPNVTSDAAGLCLKSGNAVLLRGSSSAVRSNIAIVTVLRDALTKHGLPEDAITLVEDTAYETAVEVMQLTEYVDCLIPRGGPSLIKSVLENARVPVIIDGDDGAQQRSAHIGVATDDDFGREFSDLKMSVAVVADLDAAIAHVNRYGTGHTEAILTRDLDAARRFTGEVDAAAVVVNASTRFTDGEEFGFGAEIGISTQKLHARGPMGLRELTTYKYVIWGDGQVRG